MYPTIGDSTGMVTPLHRAAKNGDEALALNLLGNRAFVDPHNPRDETPLYVAVESGHDGVGLILLKAKANYRRLPQRPRANAEQAETGPRQLTILDIACRRGLVKCATFIAKEMEHEYVKLSLVEQLRFECKLIKRKRIGMHESWTLSN